MSKVRGFLQVLTVFLALWFLISTTFAWAIDSEVKYLPQTMTQEQVEQRVEQARQPARTQEREPIKPDPLEEALTAHLRLQRYVARVEAREREESQPEPPVALSSGDSAPSGNLPSLLLTIRAHESGGNYSAFNPGGCEGYGCGGAFQMHLLYADDWARRYGASEWASTPPQQWPSDVQNKVALGLFYSTNPDGDHWCRWVDYC